MFHQYHIKHSLSNTNTLITPEQSVGKLNLPKQMELEAIQNNLFTLNILLTQNQRTEGEGKYQSPNNFELQNNRQEIENVQNLYLNLAQYKRPQSQNRDYLNHVSKVQQNLSPQGQRIPERNNQFSLQQKNPRLLMPVKNNQSILLPASKRSNYQSLLNRTEVVSDQSSCQRKPMGWLDMNVVERNEKWNFQRNEKIKAKQNQKFEQETDGCTFKPSTHKGKSNYRTIGVEVKSPLKSSKNNSINNRVNYSISRTNTPLPFTQPSYKEIFKFKQILHGITDQD